MGNAISGWTVMAVVVIVVVMEVGGGIPVVAVVVSVAQMIKIKTLRQITWRDH